MSLIEDIKHDRKNGTPGPWGLHMGDICVHGSDGDDRVIAGVGKSYGARSSVYSPIKINKPEGRANAERLIRVPDMEAALLAAEELAAKYQECLEELLSVYHSEFDGVFSDADFAEIEGKHSAALAAYRAATGATS